MATQLANKNLSITLWNQDAEFYSSVSLKNFKKALREAVETALEFENISEYKISRIPFRILGNEDLCDKVIPMFQIENDEIALNEDDYDDFCNLLSSLV